MKTVKAIFRIPTGYIGADLEEEFGFEFEDDETFEEMDEQIREELGCWVDDVLDDLRYNAIFEIVE